MSHAANHTSSSTFELTRAAGEPKTARAHERAYAHRKKTRWTKRFQQRGSRCMSPLTVAQSPRVFHGELLCFFSSASCVSTKTRQKQVLTIASVQGGQTIRHIHNTIPHTHTTHTSGSPTRLPTTAVGKQQHRWPQQEVRRISDSTDVFTQGSFEGVRGTRHTSEASSRSPSSASAKENSRSCTISSWV
jgi:hypothetical protein